MRAKRRTRGIDFDSEESDEEDPDMKRRRLKLHKKRKIDGDTLDALGTCAHPAPRLADANGVCEEKHPETQAFVQAYHAEMDDDNEEFAHLDKDNLSSLRLHNDEVEVDEEDVEDENEPQEVMTANELRQQLQQAAREKVSDAGRIIAHF